MAFTYGGITYHTDEQSPTPLRDLLTGAGLPGSGTSSYYAPISQELLSKYTTGGGGPGMSGGEGGAGVQAPSINWQAMPGTAFGPAYAVNPVDRGVNLFNPALQGMDKNYGQITPTWNVNNRQLSDLSGPIIGALMAMGMPMAIGAVGGSSSIFSTLNSIIKGLGNTGGNQGTNPLTSILAILSRMRG